jgi:hypothetical protein
MKQWNICFWLKRLLTQALIKIQKSQRADVWWRLNGAAFYLNTPTFNVVTYESEEQREFFRNARAKLESGELFIPLKTIPNAGGVAIALISERGKISQEHILILFPAYLEDPRCRIKESLKLF